MASENDVERVWELVEKIGICMLASRDGKDIRSRPMAASVDRSEPAVYFLTDAQSHKDEEVRADPSVDLAFADISGQKYVSISGHATVLNDREKIRELWSTPAKAWWNDPEDPQIRVLKVSPKDAQYWDAPGTTVSVIKMAAAAVSDSRPSMGANAKVDL